MHRRERWIAFVFLALLPPFGAPAETPDSAQAERELAEIRAQIERIEARLNADLARRDTGQRELASAERALAEAFQARRQTRERMERIAEEVAVLQARIDRTGDSRNEVREQLGAQLRLVYEKGVPSRLQLLLNQQDPRRLRRHLAYHGHLSRQRLALIEELERLQRSLAGDRDDLAQQLARLSILEASQAEATAQIERERANRDQALAEIDQRISSRGQRIAQLEEDAAELEALIEELTRALEAIAMEVEIPSILELAGSLPAPLDGRLLQDFGDRRGGEVRWSGWLLEAPAGTEVRAIAHGRIAYADWLRGYGMLTIIDHGDGVMSLYGHNQSLLRPVGSWVDPGDAIALVGRSSGASQDALYFEIRRDGTAVDPSDWLSDP